MVVVESGREFCPVCRFEWAAIGPDEIPGRLLSAVNEMVDIVTHDPSRCRTRVELGRWSNFEYLAHVRDVLITIRERVILAVIEDCPTPPMLYRDERVNLGLYDDETLEEATKSIEAACTLFLRAHSKLARANGERTLVYSAAFGGVRNINWACAQALHECEHHLADVRVNQARLDD